jgi:hypothetical protein
LRSSARPGSLTGESDGSLILGSSAREAAGSGFAADVSPFLVPAGDLSRFCGVASLTSSCKAAKEPNQCKRQAMCKQDNSTTKKTAGKKRTHLDLTECEAKGKLLRKPRKRRQGPPAASSTAFSPAAAASSSPSFSVGSTTSPQSNHRRRGCASHNHLRKPTKLGN